MTKTIAERLRERAGDKFDCIADRVADAVTGETASCNGDCRECHREWFRRLADAIEAEQIADIFKPMPEGIEWPRFEDGELVRFGDEYTDDYGKKSKVNYVSFKIAKGEKVYRLNKQKDRNQWHLIGEAVKRPEPEVLDADGVPINVGDTVYSTNDSGLVNHPFSFVVTETNKHLVSGIDEARDSLDRNVAVLPCQITHRKPDTQEAIEDDATVPAATYCVRHGLVENDTDVDDATLLELHILDLLRRQRKLLGGE